VEPLGRVALVLFAVIVLAACGSSARSVQVTASVPKLPTIHEAFTPLPCHEGTTIGQEGCAERQILRSDAEIRAKERRAFAHLSGSARRTFAREESAWLLYRGTLCKAEAFGGGSERPVAFGKCVADQNRAHLLSLPLLLLRLEG
jgi:uncharacterized protein YecT (DUF1311 family)